MRTARKRAVLGHRWAATVRTMTTTRHYGVDTTGRASGVDELDVECRALMSRASGVGRRASGVGRRSRANFTSRALQNDKLRRMDGE